MAETLEPWIHSIHVLGAIIWVGGGVMLSLIGAIYLSRIAIQLDRLTAGTDLNLREARDLLGRWIVGYQIILVILIFAVWDMVYKPGL